MSLRVEVQRCPAVPTAPKTAPITDISRSALSEMMIALLPPNSRIVLPNRPATADETSLPIFVEPVNETNETRLSSFIRLPHAFPVTRLHIPSGRSFAFNTLAIIF
ncbi:hypothetical protein D3C87_1626470 [compost metagenome]